jgi:hypothetical protein
VPHQHAGDVAEGDQRAGVGPLEVVQHQHHRPVGAQPGQEPGDRIQQAQPLLVGLQRLGRGDRAQRLEQPGDQPGERAGGRAELGPQPGRADLRRIPGDGLDERLVRRHPGTFEAAPRQHQGATPAGGRRELLEQAGLADPGLAQDRHDLGGAGSGILIGREQPGQLVVAAIAGVARHHRRLIGGPPGQGGILAQDPVVEVLQLRAGVDTQLLAQRPPQGAEPLQCLGLPAIPIARQQQLPPAALAQRVAGDHDLQLPDQVVMAAQRQLSLGQILPRGLAQLLQPSGLRLRERQICELCQRPPAPQRQRLTQQPRRGRRVARGLAALGDQPLGQARVHQVGWCLQPVPRGVGEDPHALGGLEGAPQPQDVVLQRVGGRPRRMLAPQRLSQLVLADRFAGVQRQHREQAALLGRAEPHRPRRPRQLQRPQDPKRRCTRPHAASLADHHGPVAGPPFKKPSSSSSKPFPNTGMSPLRRCLPDLCRHNG